MKEENFPYITSIHVKDCFASKDFKIPISDVQNSPRHLILTGRNGSGKTTILKALSGMVFPSVPVYSIQSNTNEYLYEYTGQVIDVLGCSHVSHAREKSLFVFFPATRKLQVRAVKVPTQAESLSTILLKDGNQLAPEMVQFLVNKKVAQAFAQIANRNDEVESTNRFFGELEDQYRDIFFDKDLRLVFLEKGYDFDFVLGDGRKVNFSKLPDGFSAFLYILMDLKMRVDAIRMQKRDWTYDPHGLVLIDEPELHLHLELQYRVMPFLTKIFPKIQFIVATHSPAVISSIRNATIFDLTTKKIAPKYTPGSSFSELMQLHFGLENEFGPVADQFLDDARAILKKGNSPEAAAQLKKLIAENEDVLTPTLRLELESTLIHYQAEQKLKK